MHLEFAPPTTGLQASDAVAFLAYTSGELSKEAKGASADLQAALTRAVLHDRFDGAVGETLDLLAPSGSDAGRVLLVGVGDAAPFDSSGHEAAGAQAYKVLRASGAETLVLDFGGSPEAGAQAAFGALLAAYQFERYRTMRKPKHIASIRTIKIVSTNPDAAEKAFQPLRAAADAIAFSRDLASEPGNTLYPAAFADRVLSLTSLGLEVEVLDESQMEALGMGALLAVGQGSRRESRLVVMRWRGAEDPDAQPLAFVGKGVCFDSGGISIKPGDHMEDMKWDMAGAGAVAGALRLLAERRAKVNVVAVLGLVENMPDGAALKPGDVITTMSSKTVEVINTDAEGRLVLADALWYVRQRFNPRCIVDLATLTGAIIVALGHDYAGLYANDETLAQRLIAAGDQEREPVWRMPLPKAYEKHIESKIADLKNLGARGGGSITAALFLQHFIDGCPWAHLDIAGAAWRDDSTDPTVPDGASGFGVRLLDRFAAGYETTPA